MKAYTAPKRLYVNADWSEIVPANHPDAAYLLAPEGGEVPLEQARKLGLLNCTPEELEAGYIVEKSALAWAARRRETTRTFTVGAPLNTFVAVLWDLLQGARYYELPDGLGQLTLNMQRRDKVEAGVQQSRIDIDAYYVPSVSDGAQTKIHSIPQAIQVIIMPTRSNECRVTTLCTSRHVEGYYKSTLLLSIGDVYPETGLRQPAEVTSTSPAQGKPNPEELKAQRQLALAQAKCQHPARDLSLLELKDTGITYARLTDAARAQYMAFMEAKKERQAEEWKLTKDGVKRAVTEARRRLTRAGLYGNSGRQL